MRDKLIAGLRRILRRVKANSKVKDALFRYIFNHKEELLQLYNALNHSNYQDASELHIVTFENAIYLTMKEDLAFLVANTLNLYEHQSTKNPNMPLRGLIYLTERYEDYIRKKDANIYGSTPLLLPSPRFIVLYNGTDMKEDRGILKLSDLYITKEDAPALECIATVININIGHNQELLSACKPLYEYSYFIQEIRNYQDQDYTYEEAMEMAIKDCIRKGILEEALINHTSAVRRMLITHYDAKKHIRHERAEARAEGLQEGRQENRQEMMKLIKYLTEENRMEDLVKITQDEAYLNQLLAEMKATESEKRK